MTEKRRKYRTQEDPFCIQIELTEGCNLRCAFCGLQGIRAEGEKNYKCMTPETLRAILEGVRAASWTPRLEFAMHGEPTMHPDYIGMIKLTRELAPRLQIMMTSNGGGLLRKPGPVANVAALFNAGLNILALDNYKGVGIVPKIVEALHAQEFFEQSGVLFYNYPEQPEGNPHQRHPRSHKFLSVIADIEESSKGTHATLTNHAGCGLPPLEEPLMKQCAKPFREIGVRWDGNMAGCCNDWRGVIKVGNVNDTSIEELWQGNVMGAMREKLFRGERDFSPCDVCDYRTYRNGLLPDNSGKAKLHRPDAQTEEDLKKAIRGAPYTEARLREWER